MHKTLTTQKTAERKNDELTQYERLTTHAGVCSVFCTVLYTV
jgi:hypothetical protein